MRKLAKKYVLMHIIYYAVFFMLCLSFIIIISHFAFSLVGYFISFIVFIILLCIFSFIHVKACRKISADLFDIFQSGLDPKELLDTDNIKLFTLNPLDKAYGKLCTGEFKEAVDICNREIRYNKKKMAKYIFLDILAFVYFQLDDVDLLKDTCDKIDFLTKDNPRLAARLQPIIYRLYVNRFYIDGQYDKCIECYQKRLVELEIKPSGYNLARLNNYFFMAVCYFKNKDADNAKKWFEEVIRFGPKMYVAEISKQYLAKIENGDFSDIEFPKVLPEKQYKMPKNLIVSRVSTLVCIILITLGIVLIVRDVFNVFRPSPRMVLFSMLSKYYDDLEILGQCEVKYDGDVVDSFALVLAEDQMDIFTLVYYDDVPKEFYRVYSRLVDVQVDGDYAMLNVDHTHVTEISLVDSDDVDAEEYIKKFNFEIDGRDMALVIKDVYTVDQWNLLNQEYLSQGIYD